MLPGRIETRQFWDLNFVPRQAFPSLEAAGEALSNLLRETIGLHMISDVPVGFLLSGGMDSSAVLSYAASETDREISTFTVGFSGPGVIDERPYARLVAKQHNARHYELTFSAEDFWDYLPRLFWHLDEPICEPPAVALHYISQLARRHVKVLLSGEGGDEAFGGYPNYPNQLMLHRLRRLCGPSRGLVGRGAVALGDWLSSGRLSAYGRMLPLELQDYYWSRAGSPFRRGTGAGGLPYTPGFQTRLNGHSQHDLMRALFARVAGQRELNQMLYIDTKTWLPDDLLIKADKVTMGNSLELRVPLLDHRVLEFAASLPPDFKVRSKETKRVLKSAFRRVLPEEIIEAEKGGVSGSLWSLACG